MFPIQTRLLTPNRYSRPQTKLKGVKGIVIHWTANENKGADAEANRMYFENRKYGKTGFGSAHYFVDSTEIVLCVPENEMAYHVGATSYKTTRFGSYPNNCLLGIEMCINADGNFKVVYDQTVELTAKLVKKYNLNPDKDIVRHYDITGKNCPGYFTSNHWGKTNHSYAVKYGLGSNAETAWKNFLNKVKAQLNMPVQEDAYPYNPEKGIGTIEVRVDHLNVRKGNSFSAPVAKTVNQGDVYYVYAEANGMYDLGGGLWVSAGTSYVSFRPHPAPKPSKKEEAIAMFKDVANHWAKGEIEELAKKGIILGDTEGNFNPNDNATRAQIAVFIKRTLDHIEKTYK